MANLDAEQINPFISLPYSTLPCRTTVHQLDRLRVPVQDILKWKPLYIRSPTAIRPWKLRILR